MRSRTHEERDLIRRQILELFIAGNSDTTIAKSVGCSRHYVRNERFKMGLIVEPRPTARLDMEKLRAEIRAANPELYPEGSL